MSNRNELSRRSVLKVMGGVGASFMLGSFATIACADPSKNNLGASPAAFEPNAYLKIDPDGTVTLVAPLPDSGQGMRTSMTMIVADELDCDWSKVKVVQAPTNSQFGHQGTGGSASVRGRYKEMREMGAAARNMLVAAAAKTWGVDPGACTTDNGRVHHASGKSMGYGELASLAATMPVPDGNTHFKDKSQFKLIGKGANRVDNFDVATGRAMFGLDVKVENMAYAVIARRPAFGATLKDVDDAAARKGQRRSRRIQGS